MANFFLVNRDFHSSREAWFCKIIFRETRNKCLIRREPWFSLCLCYFRQPLLRNKWYYVTVTGRLIPVATTWLVWFSVTFGQPSFSSFVSSISTIMAEAHQRDVRDDQDRHHHRQGQQTCMVLPNVTVLLRFSQTCELWSSKANWRVRFSLPSIILRDLLGNKTLL